MCLGLVARWRSPGIDALINEAIRSSSLEFARIGRSTTMELRGIGGYLQIEGKEV